jgi:crotonobetainyl-CoA:carnitine CoA-transferase CaiB-like acyl-CoA transferase
LSDGALTGHRVLDLSRFGPGLLSGMVLADLGADVIRVDEPTTSPTGLASRSVGLDRTHPAYALNRGKRSLAVDLKCPEGRAIFLRLAATADVLIEGFRPGVAARLGIDYASVSAHNNRLVYCSITGYGQTGPLRDIPGHDLNYAAVAGLLGLTGFADRSQPAVLGIPFADFAGGSLTGVVAILAALLARAQTGRGQYLDVAITDGAMLMLALQYARYQIEGQVPQLGTDRLNGGAPYHNLYETADARFVAVAASEPRFWRNLCCALDLADLADKQLADGDVRVTVFDRLRKKFLERTRDEWMQLLLNKDACVSPVLGLDELASDPHIRAREMIVERAGPTGETVQQVGVGLRFSDTPAAPGGSPAAWGQHTSAILAELGLTEQEVASLRSR